MLKRFDFKCSKCSHLEEKWVNGSEPFSTCSKCGNTAQRIISPVQTQFKGVGWPDADDKWAKDHERAARK